MKSTRPTDVLGNLALELADGLCEQGDVVTAGWADPHAGRFDVAGAHELLTYRLHELHVLSSDDVLMMLRSITHADVHASHTSRRLMGTSKGMRFPCVRACMCAQNALAMRSSGPSGR